MANLRLSHYPDIGILGEDLVSNWLLSAGWKILHRRWRCRYGELDLIALSGQEDLQPVKESTSCRVSFNQPIQQSLPSASGVVAFVEVKTRSQGNWDGDGVLAITSQKQKKLWRAAEIFLAQNPNFANLCCRFDVALVSYRRLSRNSIQVESYSDSVSNAISHMRSPWQLGQPILVAGYQLSLEQYIQSAFEQVSQADK